MTASRWRPAFSWLDVKLGLRMMRKSPGVSLVIVLALAAGIPVSLIPNHLVTQATGQSPPFDEGERVVGVIGYGRDGRTDLGAGDFVRLRESLTTIGWLGAAIPIEVNVISGDGWSEGEDAALTTASVFALSRVPPMLGRALVDADEVAGAPDVAVVGHDFWRRRLGGSRDAVGTTFRIDGVRTTIVGVMPEGFAMPNTQQLWLPLRIRSAAYANEPGPAVRVYGRLANGASFAQARTELRAVSLPTLPARPDSIRAEVVAFSTVEIEEPEGTGARLLLTLAQVVPVIVLLIACGNAAILILARTATRWGEVAVRTVLGASRGRIMGQLFVEALLLALLATGIGLFALDTIVARLAPRLDLPFWFNPRVTPALALKALGISVLCAVVAGVLPALRATGRSLQRTLQSAASGGGSLRLGRVAGALIVIEIGLAIVALFAGGMTWLLFRPYPGEHTWAAPADRYLVASIRIPRSGLEPAPAAPSAAPADDPMRLRVASLQDDLARRLMSEPGVRGSTFSDQPAGEEADERLVRVDGQPATSIGVATFVHPSFFAVLGVPPVSGRLFDAGDVSFDPAAAPTAVAVNMTFLERLGMDPRRAVGRRIRFTDAEDRDPGPWMEIVGVVPNIEPSEARADIDGTPAVFVPATPGTLNPMTLTIDLGRRPLAFEPRLRSLLGEADPSAILSDVYALDRLPVETNVFSIGIGVMTGISLLAILLSTTALYALMSMTVAQRKREFGIRLALGGSTGAVMAAVARRALVQIALGVAWGTGFWVAVMSWAMSRVPARGPGETLALWPYVLAAAAVVVIALALVGSLGPTLRCVRRRPIDTLRVDA